MCCREALSWKFHIPALKMFIRQVREDQQCHVTEGVSQHRHSMLDSKAKMWNMLNSSLWWVILKDKCGSEQESVQRKRFFKKIFPYIYSVLFSVIFCWVKQNTKQENKLNVTFLLCCFISDRAFLQHWKSCIDQDFF